MEAHPDDPETIFKKFLATPVHKYILDYSLFQLLGDVTNLSVLDFGCLEGHYSRLVKEKGAERVVGLGMSAELLQIAERHEDVNRQGIQYVTYVELCHIRNFQFDVVFMMMSLNRVFCHSYLINVCKAAHYYLTPGGRLVTIFAHRQPLPADNIIFENQYFTINYPDLSVPEEPALRVISFFDKNLFVSCLEVLKFQEVEWRPCSVSPHSGYHEEFWQDIVESEIFNSVTCVKSVEEQ